MRDCRLIRTLSNARLQTGISLSGQCSSYEDDALKRTVANGDLTTSRQWWPVATKDFSVCQAVYPSLHQSSRGCKTVHTVRTPTLIGDRLWRNGEPSGTDTSPFSSTTPGYRHFTVLRPDPGYRHFTIFRPSAGYRHFTDFRPSAVIYQWTL